MPMSIFKMIVNEQDQLCVFDKTTGLFEKMDKAVIHAHAVNGIFRVEGNDIEFKATSFKRFKVALAYASGDGIFELKCLLTTHEDGIRSNPAQGRILHESGTYRIPPEFDLNTVFMLGIIGSAQASDLECQIYPKDNGVGDKVILSGKVKETCTLDSSADNGILFLFA